MGRAPSPTTTPFDRPANELPATNAATGGPRIILQMEGATIAAAAISAFWFMGESWWLFAALILIPDISMLGYIFGSRIGAATYNMAHSYIGPGILFAASLQMSEPTATAVALVWIAHVGADRALGYGLKYERGFAFTHLGTANIPGKLT